MPWRGVSVRAHYLPHGPADIAYRGGLLDEPQVMVLQKPEALRVDRGRKEDEPCLELRIPVDGPGVELYAVHHRHVYVGDHRLEASRFHYLLQGLVSVRRGFERPLAFEHRLQELQVGDPVLDEEYPFLREPGQLAGPPQELLEARLSQKSLYALLVLLDLADSHGVLARGALLQGVDGVQEDVVELGELERDDITRQLLP